MKTITMKLCILFAFYKIIYLLTLQDTCLAQDIQRNEDSELKIGPNNVTWKNGTCQFIGTKPRWLKSSLGGHTKGICGPDEFYSNFQCKMCFGGKTNCCNNTRRTCYYAKGDCERLGIVPPTASPQPSNQSSNSTQKTRNTTLGSTNETPQTSEASCTQQITTTTPKMDKHLKKTSSKTQTSTESPDAPVTPNPPTSIPEPVSFRWLEIVGFCLLAIFFLAIFFVGAVLFCNVGQRFELRRRLPQCMVSFADRCCVYSPPSSNT